MHLVVPPGGAFREVRRIELGARPLTIGRDETCDIRLDVPGVDAEHAKVSEVALVAMGADCAVGDVPLDRGSRRLLMPGDELQIGSVVLALEGDDPSLMPPSPDDAQEAPALGSGPALPGPRLRVVEGPNFGDELLLAEEGKPYVIGRGASCALVLEDREVSREHITIVRKGYSVYVKDQSSTRGSWIGRATVYQGSTIEWKRPSMLKLGATVLSLDLPEAYRRVNAPALASAPMTPAPRKVKGKPESSPSLEGAAGAGASSATTVEPAGAPARATPSASEAIITPSTPSLAPRSAKRTAWKKTGPRLGRVGAIALLAFATVAVVGVILAVFSLIE